MCSKRASYLLDVRLQSVADFLFSENEPNSDTSGFADLKGLIWDRYVVTDREYILLEVSGLSMYSFKPQIFVCGKTIFCLWQKVSAECTGLLLS